MLRPAINTSTWISCGLLVAAWGCLLGGCSSEDRVYRLSGTATYKGKPIPEGYIVFEPDSSNGNTGAAGRCKILDGQFDTSQDDGRGTVGGPHLVRIVGLSGKTGGGGEGNAEIMLPVPLFKPYEVAVDLPKEDSTYDFEIPAS